MHLISMQLVLLATQGIENIDVADVNEGQIVVESGDGELLGEVRVFDVMGRMVAGSYPSTTALRRSPSPDSGEEFGWRVTFEVPGSGLYIVRIGDLPAKKIVVIR